MKNKVTPIWEYEQTEDSDFRLEQIFEFLFEDVKKKDLKMNEIVVSEIQVIPVKPKNGLVAFASCVINGFLYLGGLAIYTCLSSSEGFRVVYPTKILNNGSKLNLVYPITRGTGLIIQKEIAEEYLRVVEKLSKGNEYAEPQQNS